MLEIRERTAITQIATNLAVVNLIVHLIVHESQKQPTIIH